jgi:hypothetical protein
MSSRDRVELKVKRSGKWVRVYAEVGGKDASHLSYARRKLQLGEEAAIDIAGIGGVGTEKNHRQKGLASKVFARALAEMQTDGLNAAALYTSRRIVAHRLYRRFGLSDVSDRRPCYKILDPAALARTFLSTLVRHSVDLQARSLALTLTLDASGPIYLTTQGNEVATFSRAPQAIALSLRMSDRTLLRLWLGEIRLSYALAAKLVLWDGDQSVLDLLCRSADAHARPVSED